MRTLLLGIAEFRRSRRQQYAGLFANLAHGQNPDVLAIACCDSRISPVEFASIDPGDAFVIRTVGNLIPPFDTARDRAPAVPAAVEYALAKLPIADIVVCGHSACGAIHAIFEGLTLAGAPHLDAWLDFGRIAPDRLPPCPAGLSPEDHLSQQNVLRQVEHVRTYPGVRDAETAGRLRLHAWWFDVARADVLDFDATSKRFVLLDEARIEARVADDARRPPPPR